MSGHDHGHDHGPDVSTRRLAAAAVANAGYGVAQVVGGLLIGSVAVLADAAHQAADSLGLLIALGAALLSRRPPSDRRSFGWGRVDALGAQVSASLLLASLAWLLVVSVQRLLEPTDVAGVGVTLFGLGGMVVNGAGIVLLGGLGGHGHGLSVRAARLHLLTDLGGSVAVLLAGVGVSATGWEALDPAASIAISLAAVAATVGLLRRSADVLLDRVPAHLDLDDVRATLAAEPGVEEVHHLHVWSLGGSEVALSAHVRLAGDLALHDAQERTRGFEALLHDRFGIGHTTLQVECHDCGAPVHHR